jgi:hypothetical protein
VAAAAHHRRGGGLHRVSVGPQRQDFALSEDGDTYVISALPTFSVLGKNSLGEMTVAMPAVVRGDVIIRTVSKLYRISRVRL